MLEWTFYFSFFIFKEFNKIFRNPKPIPVELIQNSKNTHFVRYVKNPSTNLATKRLNICHYNLNEKKYIVEN